MIENEKHFSFGKDRYTECGLDTWEKYVKTSHMIELVSCETCLGKLGFDFDCVDELLDQPCVIL